MLRLSGFELYPRWVPLNNYIKGKQGRTAKRKCEFIAAKAIRNAEVYQLIVMLTSNSGRVSKLIGQQKQQLIILEQKLADVGAILKKCLAILKNMVSSGAFLMFSLYVYEALKRKGWGRWEYFRKTARSLFNKKK